MGRRPDDPVVSPVPRRPRFLTVIGVQGFQQWIDERKNAVQRAHDAQAFGRSDLPLGLAGFQDPDQNRDGFVLADISQGDRGCLGVSMSGPFNASSKRGTDLVENRYPSKPTILTFRFCVVAGSSKNFRSRSSWPPFGGDQSREIIRPEALPELLHRIRTGILSFGLLGRFLRIRKICSHFLLPSYLFPIKKVQQLTGGAFPHTRRGIRQVRIASHASSFLPRLCVARTSPGTPRHEAGRDR